MPAKAKLVAALVDELAPPELAADWDNVGWQLGDPGSGVGRVMVALDVTPEVCAEARDRGVGLIVCHHPLLFKSVKSIRTDQPGGALLAELIRSNIAVYTAHTNLDAANGGVNDVLARRLGLTGLQVLKPGPGESYLKLVVFVPVEHTDAVREAVGRAGAGWIGNYSDCAFQLRGTGTFRPREGANPYLGRQGQLEMVEEMRLETIVRARDVSSVVRAMLAAHPYEEAAYDLYPLKNQGPSQGFGRVGKSAGEMPLADYVQFVKAGLNLAGLRYGGELSRMVRKVAVCGGSGADFWPLAARAGADVLVTGDIGYHAAVDMRAAGLAYIDAGHYCSERVVVPEVYDHLVRRCREEGLEVEIIKSQAGKDPFLFG
ncbi:MAG: Nif3-like dinuclear metal center hexameric protein [Bacillota bacterium]